MNYTETVTLKDNLVNLLNFLRPHFQADGGDMEIIGVTDDMIVQIKLIGACKTCPRSGLALKGGITEYFRSSYPEIRKVVAVDSPSIS